MHKLWTTHTVSKTDIKFATKYTDAFVKGYYQEIPFTLILHDTDAKDTPCAFCSGRNKLIEIFKNELPIVAHELMHMVDYINHQEWEEEVDHTDELYNVYKLIKLVCRKYREVGRDITKMDIDDQFYFMAYYLLDPYELRANIFASYYSGEIQPYLHELVKCNRNMSKFEEMFNSGEVKLIEGYTIETMKRRFVAISKFIDNMNKNTAAKAMEEVINDNTFRTYGL